MLAPARSGGRCGSSAPLGGCVPPQGPFPLGEGTEEGALACGDGSLWGWRREQENDAVKEEILRGLWKPLPHEA